MEATDRARSRYTRIQRQRLGLWLRSTAVGQLGDLEKEKAGRERAAELARELGHDELLGWVLSTFPYHADKSGDRRGILGYCQQAVEIAARVGTSLSMSMADCGLALAIELGSI